MVSGCNVFVFGLVQTPLQRTHPHTTAVLFESSPGEKGWWVSFNKMSDKLQFVAAPRQAKAYRTSN
jgi:hypothetical protein